MATTIKSRKEMLKALFDSGGGNSKRREYEQKLEEALNKKKKSTDDSSDDGEEEIEEEGIELGKFDAKSNVLTVKSTKKSKRKEKKQAEDTTDAMDVDGNDDAVENGSSEQKMADSDDEADNIAAAADDDGLLRTNATSATVEKEDDLEYDIFHLMAFDKHPIDKKQYEANPDQYILNLARDNAQLLVAKIFSQELTSTVDGLFMNMPDLPSTSVPREKHIPKPKLLTKWEQFKKDKGLITRKKDKLVFDEASQEWRPAFGWKRANSDKNEWIVPAKEGDELGSDPFIEKRRSKKKAVQLQKKNEIANKRRQENFENNIPGSVYMSHSKGLDPKNFRNRDKAVLEKSFDFAKFSTASMGKFDKKLRAEPKNTGIKHARKEKVGSGQFTSEERNTQNQVLNRVLRANASKKRQISDKGLAVYQKVSERERRKEKKSELLQGGNPSKKRKSRK